MIPGASNARAPLRNGCSLFTINSSPTYPRKRPPFGMALITRKIVCEWALVARPRIPFRSRPLSH
jgi:hypothetical protein